MQRGIDIPQLNSNYDIVPLLKEVVLLQTVENVGPYSKLLTVEFYCNFTESINDPTNPKHYKVFIRGKWYKLSPMVIN